MTLVFSKQSSWKDFTFFALFQVLCSQKRKISLINNLRQSAIDKSKIKKVLVFRTDRVGDVLLSIPAIRALQQSFPKAQISVVVQKSFACLLEGCLNIKTIITYNKKRDNGFWGTLKFIINLRKKRFDLAVVLNPKKRSNIIAFLSGIPYRLGYQHKWGFLLNYRVDDKKYEGKKHEIEYNLNLVANIGAYTDDKNFYITVKKEDEDFIDFLLKKSKVKNNECLIAIHPGSSCHSKMWRIDRFAQVGQRIKDKRQKAIIIIIGSKEEEELGKTLERLIQKRVVNLTGKLNLDQLAALFKRCSLLISTDSGPVHIAGAVGLKSIVIFGRNLPGLSPARWGPRGKDDVILHNPPDCQPCLAHNCQRDFECLDRISVGEVVEASIRILDKEEK